MPQSFISEQACVSTKTIGIIHNMLDTSIMKKMAPYIDHLKIGGLEKYVIIDESFCFKPKVLFLILLWLFRFRGYLFLIVKNRINHSNKYCNYFVPLQICVIHFGKIVSSHCFTDITLPYRYSIFILVVFIILQNNTGRWAKHKMWYFAMLEVGKDPKPIIYIISRRSSHVLFALIKKHVKIGTCIITDQWAAYRKLKDIGYPHFTVRHKSNFVDPSTGLVKLYVT